MSFKNETYVLGDIQFNASRREVSVEGNVKRLTPQEAEFLCYLVNRYDKPPTAQEVITHIWGGKIAPKDFEKNLGTLVAATWKKLGKKDTYFVRESGLIKLTHEPSLVIERTVKSPPPESDLSPIPPRITRRLPSVQPCYGRENEIEKIVGFVTAKPTSHILIYGPPGIGKGTVALHVLHDQRVKTRFHDRRVVISCETCPTLSAILLALADAFNLPPDPRLADLKDQILIDIENHQTALVLDNFETPLLHGRESGDVERFLLELTALPSLALVVACRGTVEPSIPIKWTCSVKLSSLPPEDARRLFLSVADSRFSKDPMLYALLAELDGHPLATKLLGYRANLEPNIPTLSALWRNRRTAILDREMGDDRSESLAASLTLSINNQWMKEPQRELLSCLAFAPAGMTRRWLSYVGLADLYPALGTLARLGLVEIDGDWLRMLAPIRDYVNATFEAPRDRLSRIATQTIVLAKYYCEQIGQDGGLEATRRLRPIITNVEAALRYKIRGKDWKQGAIGARKFTSAITLALVGDASILNEAYERAKQESATTLNPTVHLLVAELRQCQARVAENLGDLEEAAAGYQEAHKLAEQLDFADSKRLLAKLTKDMADVYLAKKKFKAAWNGYTAARPLLERLSYGRGVYECRLGKAAAELGLENPTRAYHIGKRVLHEIQSLDPTERRTLRGTEGKTCRVLAEVLLSQEHHERALIYGMRALTKYSRTGDIRNCSRSASLAIHIVCMAAAPEEYFDKYRAYLKNVHSVSRLHLFRHLHDTLGRKAIERERHYHTRAAAEILIEIG